MYRKAPSLLQIRVTPQMLKRLNLRRKRLGMTMREMVTRMLVAALKQP